MINISVGLLHSNYRKKMIFIQLSNYLQFNKEMCSSTGWQKIQSYYGDLICRVSLQKSNYLWKTQYVAKESLAIKRKANLRNF